MTSGTPDHSTRLISSASADEQIKIDVTDADSSGSFSQEVRSMYVYNDGPSVVHYNRTAAATTDNIPIPAKSWIAIDVPVTTPHFICAAAGGATVYCLGVF